MFGNVERSREKEIEMGKPKGKQGKREKKCEAAVAPVLLVVMEMAAPLPTFRYLAEFKSTEDSLKCGVPYGNPDFPCEFGSGSGDDSLGGATAGKYVPIVSDASAYEKMLDLQIN
ncbi:hypothetical protein L2E82_44961 [Cichorium intybus]|uniref:Uncharacterized protein n=1 Tax=Cichorium intybus TaxID=13427 RepID=A0ACB8ZSJ5_CICIN|nr:hypothetical protein L2E82_44961 [Cichorium intybus]